GESDDVQMPPMPGTSRRSIMRRNPERMSTITEDDAADVASIDLAERRAARRRQLLEE
ncbi:hypothetical protein H4S02_001722, partial [Coemansia sp. RSA 2611]